MSRQRESNTRHDARHRLAGVQPTDAGVVCAVRSNETFDHVDPAVTVALHGGQDPELDRLLASLGRTIGAGWLAKQRPAPAARPWWVRD